MAYHASSTYIHRIYTLTLLKICNLYTWLDLHRAYATLEGNKSLWSKYSLLLITYTGRVYCVPCGGGVLGGGAVSPTESELLFFWGDMCWGDWVSGDIRTWPKTLADTISRSSIGLAEDVLKIMCSRFQRSIRSCIYKCISVCSIELCVNILGVVYIGTWVNVSGYTAYL